MLLYKFLCSSSVNDIKQFFDSNNIAIKSKDLSKAAFTAARSGNLSRLKVFIDRKSSIIYEEDVNGKSLLEAAAENFHPEIVQYIIHKHNEIYKNQNGKTADEVSSEFLGFIDNIGDKEDPWAKDLAKELKKALNKEDFNESDGLKIDRILSPQIDNKKKEKEVKNLNTDNYGNISYYADIIKSDNTEKFKTALEKIDPKRKLYSLLNSDGHNLVTLTAALGTSDHWQEVEKAYSKIEGRAAHSASLDNTSSVGSPIQAAIIANNLSMYNHFLNSKDGFVINKQYGKEENNILHTILQSDRVELLNYIIFKFKDDKKPLFEALKQINKDKESPLALALIKGHYGFFEKALDVIANHNKETIKGLLIANDCELIKSVISFGNERAVERVLSLQNEYNKGVKNKKDQLNLLNYNNHYDKENRLEESGLLNLSCKNNNTQAANYVLKLLKKEKNVSSKVSVNALIALISKDSKKFDNKEIFDFLFSQDVNFDALSKGVTAQYSLVHKAAECGNIGALNYFINKFPKNDILNLQDESGRTPLHLAISSGHRKTAEFLIECGADFDKSDNKGVTPFELALENNKFADICIDLLKYNPEATIPIHRVISSGNESLIENLIDRSDWVLDQCDMSNAAENHNLIDKETALKFALRSGINEGLTAKIADKSIENFKKLDKKSQKILLELGFLNDVVKSGIYNLHKEGSKRAGEINEFIRYHEHDWHRLRQTFQQNQNRKY